MKTWNHELENSSFVINVYCSYPLKKSKFENGSAQHLMITRKQISHEIKKSCIRDISTTKRHYDQHHLISASYFNLYWTPTVCHINLLYFLWFYISYIKINSQNSTHFWCNKAIKASFYNYIPVKNSKQRIIRFKNESILTLLNWS